MMSLSTRNSAIAEGQHVSNILHL